MFKNFCCCQQLYSECPSRSVQRVTCRQYRILTICVGAAPPVSHTFTSSTSTTPRSPPSRALSRAWWKEWKQVTNLPNSWQQVTDLPQTTLTACLPAVASVSTPRHSPVRLCQGHAALRYTQRFKTKASSAPVPGLLTVQERNSMNLITGAGLPLKRIQRALSAHITYP